MTKKILQKTLIMAALQLALITAAFAQTPIIEDKGFVISDEEFEYLVTLWTKQMRDVAIADPGDRLELINIALANKKLAAAAEEIARDNSELSRLYRSGLEAYQRNFVLKQARDNIQLPDFSDLAKEQYTVNRDKYAAIPERRISSHILFSVPLGDPRDDVLAQAQVVLDELRAGADFVAMVEMHSGEPGAAAKEGKFDRWLKFGEVGVTPPYTEGLFTIENVGEYAELVQTQYGVHIIRLDGIQEKDYKPFEEVKNTITSELEKEYIQLTMKDYLAQFNLSDDAVIDNEAIDAILAPYAKQE
ncbi:MAG: peptidylprolyl isomerase [Halioglobus sp.]